jgi:hypothetical protein
MNFFSLAGLLLHDIARLVQIVRSNIFCIVMSVQMKNEQYINMHGPIIDMQFSPTIVRGFIYLTACSWPHPHSGQWVDREKSTHNCCS